jgi:hypothetical protein
MVRKSEIRLFANENILIISRLNWFSFAGSFAEMPTLNHLSFKYRLQTQAVLFAVCKEKRIENQGVYLNSFAGLFANNSN